MVVRTVPLCGMGGIRCGTQEEAGHVPVMAFKAVHWHLRYEVKHGAYPRHPG
jgi:hypothetical protein